jgi:hypothetical protein
METSYGVDRNKEEYSGLPWTYGIHCSKGDLSIAEEIRKIIKDFPSVLGVHVGVNGEGFNIVVYDIEEEPFNTFNKISGIVDIYNKSTPMFIYTGL